MAELTLAELEAEQKNLERELKVARAAREILGAKHRRIDEDLAQGFEIYQLTVGGDLKSYAQWQRRATKVRDDTEKKWQKLNGSIDEMHKRLVSVSDLIRLRKSEWDGGDTMSLLTALLYALERVPLAQQGIDHDLIFAARMHAGLEKP